MKPTALASLHPAVLYLLSARSFLLVLLFALDSFGSSFPPEVSFCSCWWSLGHDSVLYFKLQSCLP